MPYIKRDAQGGITAVSQSVDDGFDELLDENSEELVSFLAQWQTDRGDLDDSDLGFIRVLEDVIDLLISKNVIRFTDLPDAARGKMQKRQRLRECLAPRLDLLFDEDNNGF